MMTDESLTDAAPQRLVRFLLGAVVLLLIGTHPAAAQDDAPVTRGATVYRYAALGETVMNVDLWGLVQEPGRYQVVPATTLVDLITLAGGPDFQVEDTKTARTTTVDVTRPGASGLSLIFTARLDHITNGSAVPPQIQDGDIVTVRSLIRQRFSWLDALSVLGSLASITFLVLRITGSDL